MKSFVIALLLFALIVGLIIANSIYVTKVMEELCDIASRLKGTKDEAQRTALIKEIDALWTKSRPLLDLTIEANELIQMNEYITAILYCSASDRDTELVRYCTLAETLAEEFMSHERLSYESIF